MKIGQGGQIDEKALMAGVNSMLSQMMSGGANPFAAMLGGAVPAAPQAQPRLGARKPKSKKK
jgi:hypothetical protein